MLLMVGGFRMQKHNTSRLYRVSEIDSEKLSFELRSDQRARVPQGEKITIREVDSTVP